MLSFEETAKRVYRGQVIELTVDYSHLIEASVWKIDSGVCGMKFWGVSLDCACRQAESYIDYVLDNAFSDDDIPF